ncbi:gamete release protein, putative [Hepatocystis sp. ex Piliocolobus tephrosceles]|nr:gamete release protein, putative [Hepatocystis sp. ex Piliocolobus tephrosceles]
MEQYNNYLPPSNETPLPIGTRILPGNKNIMSPPLVEHTVRPLIAEDHFLLNLGGNVPPSWTMNQIAHYVNYIGPKDEEFAAVAKDLLRSKGYQ